MNLKNLNVIELSAQEKVHLDGGAIPNPTGTFIGLYESGRHVFSAVIGFLAGVHDGIDETCCD